VVCAGIPRQRGVQHPGRLGDVRGKPNQEELKKIKEDTIRLVEWIRSNADGKIEVRSQKKINISFDLSSEF